MQHKREKDKTIFISLESGSELLSRCFFCQFSFVLIALRLRVNTRNYQFC